MSISTDLEVRKLLKGGKRFTGIADKKCKGLYFCYPENYKNAFWKFRYKINGNSKTLSLGSFPSVTLSEARKIAKQLRARIVLAKITRKCPQQTMTVKYRFMKMMYIWVYTFFDPHTYIIIYHCFRSCFNIRVKNIVSATRLQGNPNKLRCK